MEYRIILAFLFCYLQIFSANAAYAPGTNMYDGTGNALTSQVNGSKRALDVGINVSGVQVDPRTRTWSLLNSTDSVNAVQSGTWNLGNITGTISLPTLAATSTKQSDGSQKSQIVDGSGNVIGSALIVGMQRLGVTLASGGVPGVTAPAYLNIYGGVDTATGFAQQLQVDSSKNLKVNIQSSVIPTGASTETTLSAINTKTPALGTALIAASSPVNIASDQIVNTMTNDLFVTGQAAQTAIVNNILTTTSGAAATDTLNYKSALVQVVSTGTAGTFIFEGSNDNTNFQTIPVYSQLILTGTPITAAITATATQLGYTFPLQFRYIRLRIVTAITGGSIQAFTRLSVAPWTPTVTQVAQNTAANLLTTATIGSGTVTTVSSVTSSQQAIPGIITDVASAALTTTTTTATLTPTFGASYSVVIPVTVVSGTTPTLDVEIQESDDTGTNWVPIYDFPRITTTGFYRSPVFPMTGNRIRYVQTVTGTTPSFTRAISRLQSSLTSYTPFRQIVDRTIVLTTLNSTTPTLTTGGAKNAQVVINIGAATLGPILQIEGSDDFGASWYLVGSTLTAVASSTVQLTVSNISASQLRVRVSTAGSAVTAGYVLLKAF